MYPKLMVLGFPNLCEAVKRVLNETGILKDYNVELLTIPPNELPFDVGMLKMKDDCVVICGEGMRLILESVCSGPIVPIKVNGFDLVRVIEEAGNYDRMATIVNFKKDLPLARWEKCLSVPVQQFRFNNIDEAHSIFEKLKKEGRKTVIGGSLVEDLAKEFGLKGLLYYSDNAILEAVEKAQDIIKAMCCEIEKSRKIRAVLDITPTGIIALDRDNKVIEYNAAAERLLGKPLTDSLSCPINKLIIGKEILTDITKRRSKQNEIYVIKDVKFVCNLIPINAHNYRGMVLTLDDISTVEKTEKIIRHKLSQARLTTQYSFNDIVGISKVITKTINKANRYARTDSTILISGESGTGKELFAHSIHNASFRKDEAFLAINCAALPENLLESELFGYEEGSFTGAVKGGKRGLFEIAHGGTIFLDEICELSVFLQAKLLRVLQQKEVRRIGGDQTIPVNVRVITSTNTNLADKVRTNEFREDLYFRINVLELKIPSLRERKEDIRVLFEHLIHKHDSYFHNKVRSFLPKIDDILLTYDWPGNIRELENIAERFIALLQDTGLNWESVVEALSDAIPFNYETDPVPEPSNLGDKMKELELSLILKTLDEAGGNTTLASQKLGISRTTLWRKMKGA